MNNKDHKEVHHELHEALDELAADYMEHTGKLLSKTSVVELLEWSFEQTKDPTPNTEDEVQQEDNKSFKLPTLN